MKLLPENYNPARESENLINKAIRFADKTFDEINFAVLSSLAFVVCTKKGASGEGELYVGHSGGASQTANTPLKAGPFKFAEGDISAPVVHYIRKPIVRIFFKENGKAKYIDFNSVTLEFMGEAKDLSVGGYAYNMYKTLHGKPMISTVTSSGAALVELDGECTEAVNTYEIAGFDTASVVPDDEKGYYALCEKDMKGTLMHSADGKEWEIKADGYKLAGKPSFARLYRLYYIAFCTDEGVRIDMSKNCRDFETLIQFSGDTDVKNIAFYEWDGIIYYAALLNGKPIYSRLR